jgi:DNA-binding transcriptional MerR regulator
MTRSGKASAPTATAKSADSPLPSKLFFRIGEVAELVGVEPHVLRYWEREFRTVRPSKSAKGQRVYSRRDVESLLRVRDLLYREGFTIAGARKKLARVPGETLDEAPEPAPAEQPEPAPEPATAVVDGAADRSTAREQLLAMRREVEAFLAELG